MPLNTLRLNHQSSSHPNDRIVFIKPLPRPPTDQASYNIADTCLRAIAAQCLPIMKKHWLSVTTLEEYEPNREFIGRNFNNGECIQLVLRSKNGRWLPFNVIQMVMMHELAHNSHMNHGKLFWKERNIYAEELKRLWQKGYTGEGFWGNGKTLGDIGTAMGNNVIRNEELSGLPLCGGIYRSRGKKRKRVTGEELTSKEKKERRVEKKFGKNGVNLGEDENKRMLLEIGRKGPVGGKPRVAQSKRGRELRAAAALARFNTNKKEVDALNKEDELKLEEETDSDGYEEDDLGEDAMDLDGKPLQDKEGRGMIRICDEEDADDAHVKQEMQELEGLEVYFRRLISPAETDGGPSEVVNSPPKLLYNTPQHPDSPTPAASTPASASTVLGDHTVKPAVSSNTTDIAPGATSSADHTSCPICSMSNPRLSVTCDVCSHVLDIRKARDYWRCRSDVCLKSEYINSGDVGICGVCGSKRSLNHD